MPGIVGTHLVAQVGFIVKDIEETKKKWAAFLGVICDMLPFEDTEKEKLYLRRELFYAEEEHIPRKTY